MGKIDVYKRQIISMVVVILILPAMFMIFDKLICKTSIGFLKKKTK